MSYFLTTPGTDVAFTDGEGARQNGRVIDTFDGYEVGMEGRTYSCVAYFVESEIRRLIDGEAYHARPEVHLSFEDVDAELVNRTVPPGTPLWGELAKYERDRPRFIAKVDELFRDTCETLGIRGFKRWSESRERYEIGRIERRERREERRRVAEAKARLRGLRQDFVQLIVWNWCCIEPAWSDIDETVISAKEA